MPGWVAVLLLLALSLACLLAVVSGWSRYRTGGQNTTIIERRPSDTDRQDVTVVESD